MMLIAPGTAPEGAISSLRAAVAACDQLQTNILRGMTAEHNN
jgi:hypothetical protein